MRALLPISTIARATSASDADAAANTVPAATAAAGTDASAYGTALASLAAGSVFAVPVTLIRGFGFFAALGGAFFNAVPLGTLFLRFIVGDWFVGCVVG